MAHCTRCKNKVDHVNDLNHQGICEFCLIEIDILQEDTNEESN